MTKKDSKNPCSGCPLVLNTVNGTYCTILNIITEYYKAKPCNQ